MDKLVSDGGMDRQVVETLRADFDSIDLLRRQEQAAYGVKQGLLARMMGMAGCVASGMP